MARQEGAPTQSLSAVDVVAIIVGLVIGAGIFKAPAVVAANSGSEIALMLAWLLGGAVSLFGALCYAELSSAYPNTGGEYHYLTRAYGRSLGFLFAWSRLVVLQTGSIALLAFVFGDYVAQMLPLRGPASAVYAAAAVVTLTGLNLLGLRLSKWAQNLLTLITVLGLVLVIIVGLAFVSQAPTTPIAHTSTQSPAFGLAMVFVLLTYGGWNEAAYISAELRDVQRNMVKVLVIAIGIITVLYMLVNLAYLQVLGLERMSHSEVVAMDLVRVALGNDAAWFVSALIAVAVFTSINVTILTGARTNYALARNFPAFRFLGYWHAHTNAPVTALLVQGAIAVVLVFIGAQSRSGFETMVQYVSPVFWLFFLLTGASLFVLRQRAPMALRPFRVPGYPLVPLVFIASCAYMLYASLVYAGFGALLGLVLLAAGIPLLIVMRRNAQTTTTVWGRRAKEGAQCNRDDGS